MKYLAEISGLPYMYDALEDLRINIGEGLYTSNRERIDVLYRQIYPLEFMVEDRSENGTEVGIELLKLVQNGKLGIISPVSAFLHQSKAVQAVIWNLYDENNPFNTSVENEKIENHLIPTYLTNNKPIFGQKSDTVIIYNEKGQLLTDNPLKNYYKHMKIYQEYIELPIHEVTTPKGKN